MDLSDKTRKERNDEIIASLKAGKKPSPKEEAYMIKRAKFKLIQGFKDIPEEELKQPLIALSELLVVQATKLKLVRDMENADKFRTLSDGAIITIVDLFYSKGPLVRSEAGKQYYVPKELMDYKVWEVVE